MIKIFKTENCPACKALIVELNKKGIQYEIETSLEFAANLGIRSAPAVITPEGILRTKQEILSFLKAA